MVFGFDDGWVTEFACSEWHVCGVAGHVAERAGAEILPAAPIERVIDALLVGSVRCRAEPHVPIEVCGDRVFTGGSVDSLGPDRAIAPDVDFANIADDAGLNDFDSAAQAVFGAALVAHLSYHLVFAGELAEGSRFVHRMCERLLAIDVFAHLDCQRGSGRVDVIGRRNDDGIDRLAHFFIHFAEVTIELGFWVLFELAGAMIFIRVAEGDDVFACAVVGVTGSFSGGANDGDVDFVSGVLGEQQLGEPKSCHTCCQR